MKKLLERKKIVKNFSFEIKAVNEQEHIIEGVFSTADVDRHGESVIQTGWDLKGYQINPIVLWAHDAWEFPIAQMTDIGIDSKGNLAGKMKFAVDEYDRAATAYKLMVGKYLRAFSVGFSNNKYEVDQNEETVFLTENELFEVSVVNIPANQMALAKAKSDGIDVSLLEIEEKKEDIEEKEEKEIIKSGQVLSAKNRKGLESAMSEIQAVLDADSASQEGKSADIAQHIIKVETPKSKDGKLSVRDINKVIRQLVKEKKNINK